MCPLSSEFLYHLDVENTRSDSLNGYSILKTLFGSSSIMFQSNTL